MTKNICSFDYSVGMRDLYLVTFFLGGEQIKKHTTKQVQETTLET